jgi:hypothetical protein
MSPSIATRKLKSSTMIETLVALVILMIAFGFGMVIFMKVTTTGGNGKILRTGNQCRFLADSLMHADHKRDMHLLENGISYKIQFEKGHQQGTLIMSILAEDLKGELITEYHQLMQDEQSQQN